MQLKTQRTIQSANMQLKTQRTIQSTNMQLKTQRTIQSTNMQLKTQGSIQSTNMQLKTQRMIQSTNMQLKKESARNIVAVSITCVMICNSVVFIYTLTYRTGIQEKQYEQICIRILNFRYHVSDATSTMVSLKNERPKVVGWIF